MNRIKKWMMGQIILFLMISFPLLIFHYSATAGVNLGLVGRWNSDYGDFVAVEVAGSYAYCATSKWMVVFHIAEFDRITVTSFLELGSCSDIALQVSDEDNSQVLYGYLTNFFEKPAGKEIVFKPYDAYIIINKQ